MILGRKRREEKAQVKWFTQLICKALRREFVPTLDQAISGDFMLFTHARKSWHAPLEYEAAAKSGVEEWFVHNDC